MQQLISQYCKIWSCLQMNGMSEFVQVIAIENSRIHGSTNKLIWQEHSTRFPITGSIGNCKLLIKAILGMLGGGENLCGWLFMMELSP